MQLGDLVTGVLVREDFRGRKCEGPLVEGSLAEFCFGGMTAILRDAGCDREVFMRSLRPATAE